jgi:hypothetical protein
MANPNNDPRTDYRLTLAQQGLDRYRKWAESDGPDHLDPHVIGDLVTSTEWLVELLRDLKAGGTP